MPMMRSPFTVILGLVPVAGLAFLANALNGPTMAAKLDAQAKVAIAKADGAPVRARFSTATGSPSRHPLLSGGEKLDEGTRDRVAKAVASVPGVGGVTWVDGTALAVTTEASIKPQHCQDDVEALLNARTIRFDGGSSRIQAASGELVDEVATALRPCLGSLIAITGHTDSSGSEAGNVQLSLARARAVRDALIERGIPADGLRSRGLGSRSPVEGLDASDPANRRIEFSVLAIQPVKPTPSILPAPARPPISVDGLQNRRFAP